MRIHASLHFIKSLKCHIRYWDALSYHLLLFPISVVATQSHWPNLGRISQMSRHAGLNLPFTAAMVITTTLLTISYLFGFVRLCKVSKPQAEDLSSIHQIPPTLTLQHKGRGSRMPMHSPRGLRMPTLDAWPALNWLLGTHIHPHTHTHTHTCSTLKTCWLWCLSPLRICLASLVL
jgi:hypothetical protein